MKYLTEQIQGLLAEFDRLKATGELQQWATKIGKGFIDIANAAQGVIGMLRAMAPVITKVATVVPMIFPALRRLSILATALEMEANTMGTTMQNIMLMNTVPKGLRTVAPAEITAPSASFTTGLSHPTMAPIIMEPSMMAKNA